MVVILLHSVYTNFSHSRQFIFKDKFQDEVGTSRYQQRFKILYYNKLSMNLTPSPTPKIKHPILPTMSHAFTRNQNKIVSLFLR